jgi:uncharacterized protein YndB with AHSA1/START domain
LQTEELKRKDSSLTITRMLKAPLQLVWDIWTMPEHVKHWWGPEGFTNSIHKMDVREGGEWEFVMHGPDGTDYRNKHIFKQVIPCEKLVLEHVTAPLFTMTITFEAVGKETRVTIVSDFLTEVQLETVIKVFKADQGLRQNMDRLEDYLKEHILNHA